MADFMDEAKQEMSSPKGKEGPCTSSQQNQSKTSPGGASASGPKKPNAESQGRQRSPNQQQHLIRIQPQQVGQRSPQQNVVRVSPLTKSNSQQPQTIMVIRGSPQRLQTKPNASVVQTLSPPSGVKPTQEHGYAVKATLTHHDYAMPKPQNLAAETTQASQQQVPISLQVITQQPQTLASPPTVLASQHALQQPTGVVQLIHPNQSTPTLQQNVQQLKPLTATLQGGQLVINQQSLVQGTQAGQPVTLRLQMKDVSSLQRNVAKLQQPVPATVGRVTQQKQQAVAVTSQPQYIITNVNNSPQLQGIIGTQQIKIVSSAIQAQQPQQQVLKQLPGGGYALTVLPNSVVAPGTTVNKTITVMNNSQPVVGSSQSVLSLATGGTCTSNSSTAKTLTVLSSPSKAQNITQARLVTKVTTPVNKLINATVASPSVSVTPVAQSSASTLTMPSTRQTIHTVASALGTKTITVPASVRTIQAVAAGTHLSSAQTTAATTSLQTICSVLPHQTSAKTINVSSGARLQTAKTVGTPVSETSTLSSTSTSTTVVVQSPLATRSAGNIAKAATTTTVIPSSAAITISTLNRPSVSTAKASTITIKKAANTIRTGTPAATSTTKTTTSATKTTSIKQTKNKPAVQQTPKTLITKPIQIPGQPVGQKPGQILIMVNPGSNALQEVKKIAEEVNKLKGQPRSAENLLKLKQLQERVKQLQSSVQTISTKPLVLSASNQLGGMPKSSSGQSDGNASETPGSSTTKKEGKKHKLQEKANRIVAEAVARAKASGLQNIPKIMADVSLPEVNLEKEKKEKKKSRPKEPKPRKPPKEPKERQPPRPKAAKRRPKPKKILPRKIPLAALVRLKNKRKHLNDSSSSASEAEDALLAKALPDDDAHVEKRRSSRNTKRKRYDMEYDFKITDDDSSDSDKKGSDSNAEVDVVSVVPTATPAQNESAKFFVENPDESEANLVEKILSSRVTKKPQLPGEAQVGEIEEFYVKYRNFSYLHCEWATFDKLEKGDQRIHQKIKRFRAKQRARPSFFSEPEDEFFNPDYMLVDRILDVAVTEDPDTQEKDTHYLVKWRGLPYEESTWELEKDVEDDKIEFFNRISKPPPVHERERVEKADPDDWKKIEETPVYKSSNILRDYQLEGVNWLTFSWCNGQNCILADEMGLGKTIQGLAFLREVQKFGIQGPFLVIAPLSTIANWQREFETWTDLNAVVYHGSAQSRHMIAEFEMYFKDAKGRSIPNLYKFDVLITTYEIVLADCQELSEIEWRVVLIDEAHRLKNRNCKLLEGLRFLDMEHRVLLTGTPLQNNIDELFSLLNFLEPERFRSISQFLGDFGDLKTESQVEKLQQLLKPMMLRRLKEDVEKNLADKEETIIEVELTNIQKKYYRAILERNFSFLSKGTNSATNLPNLMNTMMELRKCCNHPFLINGAEEQIMSELALQPMNLEMTHHMRALIQSAGKMVLLDKLLPRLREGGHKLLIFSQMIRCLDILEDYLVQKRYQYERIDGRVRGNMRQAAIDRFSKPESERFVFLLCTRAGGLGINLTAADTCIIFDSDWNPQNDLQAQARCHRIGQTKSVKIYRLITRNSYEREMFDKASMKLGLDKAVLQSMRGDNQTGCAQQQQPFSKKEIEDLLRKGAYGAIMEDDDSGSKFCEEDIEMILKRRTQVMKIEGGQKGSTFAKASFTLPDDQRSDIKLDDPDFWAKWAKKAELDMEAMNKRESHVINTPRQRKQTRRFGNMDEMVEFTSNDEDSDEEQPPPPPTSKKGGNKGGHKGATATPAASTAAPVVAMKPMKPCKNQLQSGWTRLECFRVEKGLLTYGWGRWEDVLTTIRFKRPLGEKDVEAISRTMLIFCLKFYKGDENIKSFIWDLVTPAPDGSVRDYKNHKGLSAPVPRGRKSKKPKKEEDVVPAILEYDFSAKDQDPETLLTDQGYKNHLKRHCNKVLLRVRLLYYLKQEVIGDMVEKIAAGAEASELPLVMVQPEGDPPIPWWDEEADRSLLVGVFKHGYERYVAMRTDPTLCFLSRCGAPDKREIARENAINDDSQLDVESMETGGELDVGTEMDVKPVIKHLKEEYLEDGSLSPSSTRTSSPALGKPKTEPEPEPTTMPVIPGKLPFPLAPDVNTRLRRLVASYQRNHKRQQQKQAKRARREMVKQVRFEEQLRQRQLKKQENAQKWSRREEADFYRVLATYGVEQDPETSKYDWSNFRKVAKLERKYDHRLLEYYHHFRAMCLRKCKREEEISQDFVSLPPPDFTIEEISEERANKVLHRIDLLLKIRNQVLPHPEMDARMRHCRKSLELPDWWELGVHDRDMVIGVARYGINRMESQQQMLADPELCFKDLKEKYPLMIPVPIPIPPPPKAPAPATSQDESTTNNTCPQPEDDALRTKEDGVHSDGMNDTESFADSQDRGKDPEMKASESDESGIEDSGNDEPTPASSQDNVTVTEGQSSLLDSMEMENLDNAIEPQKVQDEIQSNDDEMCTDDAQDEPDCTDGGTVLNPATEAKDLRTSLLNSSQSDESKGRNPDEDMECGSPRPCAAGVESSQGQQSEITNATTNMTYAFLMKWPKDRVIVHRLENICHCVLKNCWPGRRHNNEAKMAALKQQYSAEHGDFLTAPPPMWDPSAMPPEHNYAGMADGLLALVHQKKRKRKRKLEPGMERDSSVPAKSSSELPLDLSQGSSRQSVLTDADSDDRGTEGAEPRQVPSGRALDGATKRLSAEEIRRRKKKSYLKAKLKAMHGAPTSLKMEGEHVHHGSLKRKKKIRRLNLANLKDDDHVPVSNRKTGEKLFGQDAPMKKDLVEWLSRHLDFAIQNQPHLLMSTQEVHVSSLTASEDSQEEHASASVYPTAATSSNTPTPKRRRLRNPAKLDPSKVTGEERVGIIERETGRKLSAKVVPTLKNLAEWLQKHPGYYVASNWAEIVRAKGTLPAELHSRIMLPISKPNPPPIQPATYPAFLPTSYSPNHLETSADLGNKVSMQISAGPLAGLSQYHALGLGSLPIGVAPIASLAGLDPQLQQRHKGHVKEKTKRHKSTMPRKIAPADRPLMPVGSTPGTVAGISPFLLPSTAGLFYSPFLATQGLLATSVPPSVPPTAGNVASDNGQNRASKNDQDSSSEDDNQLETKQGAVESDENVDKEDTGSEDSDDS